MAVMYYISCIHFMYSKYILLKTRFLPELMDMKLEDNIRLLSHRKSVWHNFMLQRSVCYRGGHRRDLWLCMEYIKCMKYHSHSKAK